MSIESKPYPKYANFIPAGDSVDASTIRVKRGINYIPPDPPEHMFVNLIKPPESRDILPHPIVSLEEQRAKAQEEQRLIGLAEQTAPTEPLVEPQPVRRGPGRPRKVVANANPA